jgi:sugar/nucleoside kinase (ribokinase family)
MKSAKGGTGNGGGGRADAVVAGYIGIDLAPRFHASARGVPLHALLRPGKLVETGALGISPGGAVPNTGLAMVKFGRRVYLNALVGEDALGDVAVRLLRKHGDFPGIRRTGRAGTAYSIVIAPPGVDRVFLECPGCNDVFSCGDVDFDAVRAARVFHFGYPTLMRRFFEKGGGELASLFERVKAAGPVTSLDMTLPDPDAASGKADWTAILRRVLPFVDLFAPSAEELLFMLDRKRYDRVLAGAEGRDMVGVIPDRAYRELAEAALDLGARIVMIKAGHRGLYLRTRRVPGSVCAPLGLSAAGWSNRALWVPAFPVESSRFRNACGAGDAAVAAFLCALLDGESMERAGRLAAMAGRDNLYGSDALSGLSDWKAMLKAV